MAMVYEKNKPSLNQVINDIYNEVIILNKDTTKKVKAVVTEFMDNILIPAMKKVDISFNAIYQRRYYAGSFYEGLKISDPDEFDLNIVLKLPVSENDVKVIDRWNTKGDTVLPGYAFYRSNKSPSALFPCNHQRHDDWRRLESLFKQHEEFYFLSPNCLKYWFQSVVGKALNDIKKSDKNIGGNEIRLCLQDDYLNITTEKGSGPARTLYMKMDSGMKMDIDLVPVFYFRDGPTEKNIVYLVPKPSQDDEFQWRLSYTVKEKQILLNKNCPKKCIKLLKRLRDVQGAPLKKLCSYYIKNFVILELGNHTWDESKIGDIFLSLLNKLVWYLENGEIPSYFDSDHNIMDTVRDVTIRNMKYRLQRILNDIERNPPAYMKKYFIEKETQKYESSGSRQSLTIRNEIHEAEEDSGVNWLGVGLGAAAVVGVAALFWGANKKKKR